MRSPRKDKTYFAYTEAEKDQILQEIGRPEVHHPALQGPGRKRPGYDVADHHEPRDPPADPGQARRMRQATAQMFDVLLGDNLSGPQGLYRRARQPLPGRCWIVS